MSRASRPAHSQCSAIGQNCRSRLVFEFSYILYSIFHLPRHMVDPYIIFISRHTYFIYYITYSYRARRFKHRAETSMQCSGQATQRAAVCGRNVPIYTLYIPALRAPEPRRHPRAAGRRRGNRRRAAGGRRGVSSCAPPSHSRGPAPPARDPDRDRAPG